MRTDVDGFTLRARTAADDAPPGLPDVAALEPLQQIWVQNFLIENGPEGPRVEWRTNNEISPSSRYIGSPYDAQAP